MGQAYQNLQASKTVETVNLGNLEIDKTAPTEVTFNVGNSAIYGVNSSNYVLSLAAVLKEVGEAFNLTIRAEVEGSLAKEATYSVDEDNPSFSFNAAANDDVKFIFSTNAAGAEVIKVNGARVIIKPV